jgi:hypothetical protein
MLLRSPHGVRLLTVGIGLRGIALKKHVQFS